jgi:hypothetical protein
MPRVSFTVIDQSTGAELHSITFNPDDESGESPRLHDSPFEWDYPAEDIYWPTFQVPGYAGVVFEARVRDGERFEFKMDPLLTVSRVGLVWDVPIISHNAVGTFGNKNKRLIPSETLSDYYTNLTPITSTMALNATVAKEATINALAGVVALDATVAKEVTSSAIKTNTDTIPSVKTKTDKLTFTVTNDIQARINDVGVLTPTVLADAIWDELSINHTDTGSMGEIMNDSVGASVDANRYVDQCVYSGLYLASCRIRLYSNPASVGTDNDVIATYLMTSTNTAGKMTTFKEVKQ